MRDTNSGRRLPLKSKLLAGVTGLAAATMASAAYADGAAPASSPPADPPKWSPYAEVGGGIGSGFTAGKLDFFAPVWQDLDTMLYARAGVQLRGSDNKVWNFGLGYRTKVNPDWILGVYAGWDSSDTPNNHQVHQLSGGVELMSDDWDIRANAYVSPKRLEDNNLFQLYIHDTTIAILEGQDVSYSGFDGEVGYRLWNNENTDFRVFAGGYSFTHDDIHNGSGINFDVRDIRGWKARAEVNMFDVDEIGPQSRLSFEGEVTHDSVRGTGGFVGATLRIPLGDTGSGAQALDELDRRMADPQRRMENVLSTTGFTKPEPVIIYGHGITSQPTNTLYYAQQQAGTGPGTYAHPTTIQDATARGPVNQFVVVTDFGGPVNATGTVIQSGETVVGGGQTFTVRGTVHPAAHFDHDFAPSSGTPTLTAASGADPVLVIDSTTNVQGLNFAGPFSDAIYGHNVTNVVISGVDIDGTAGGANGVHIVQDVSGDSTITIQDSSIENVSNDGVYVDNAFSDGGSSTEHLHLNNVTVANSGNNGVYVLSDVSGGSTADLNMELTSSTITGSGNFDAAMTSFVSGAGSSATQTIVVDPTTITGGLYGVIVNGNADGGTLNQYIDIDSVNFSGQTIAGAAIFAYAQNGGTVNQTVNFTNDTVAGSYFGIGIVANSATTGTVNQNFSLSNVSVDGATYDGIDIVAHADGAGSHVNQTGTMDHVTANDTLFGDGVYAYAESTYGGTTIAHLDINDVTATHNYFDGVYVGANASSSTADGSTTGQYVTVTNSNLAGNFIGFEADVGGTGNASARQDVTVSNTVFSDAAHRSPGYQFVGASADAFAFDGGSAQQTLYFINDKATDNYASGIAISANSLYTGFVTQNAEIYATSGLMDLSHNDAYGVIVSAAASSGGDIEQNVGVYNVNASHNGLGGLGVNTDSYGIAVGYALYYSHVSQNIIAVGDRFDSNGGNGVSVINYATYGAGIDQFVYVGNSSANHNTGDGIHVESHDYGASYYGYAPGTHLYSDVYVFGSTANRNGGNGISIEGDVTMPTDPTKVFGDSYMIQHIVVNGTTADHNGLAGFAASASSTGIYALNIQYITLNNNSHFDGNQGDGLNFSSSDYFGPYSFGAAIQDVTITSITADHNNGDGLHATTDSSGFQGRAEQHFSAFYSSFDNNAGAGMSFYNHAHDGAYYPGYTCNYVQGVVGGCAFVRQTVQIGYSDISGNIGDGIDVTNRVTNYGAVYSNSGRPLYQSTLFFEGSTVNGNHGDGVHMYNYVGGNSYAYQYLVALNTVFNNNHGDGIGGLNNVTGDSTLVQKVVMYGLGATTGASGNDGFGIAINSQATDGGHIGNLVVVGYSDIFGNGEAGISLNAGADSGAGTASTGVQQYVDVIGSYIGANHGHGIEVRGRATGAYAITDQYLSVVGTSVSRNIGDGVHAFEIGYAGSAANQTLYFNNDTIEFNHGDGVYSVGIAVDQSFTEQNILFGYHVPGTTTVAYNHNDGIYIGSAAFSGSDAEQNAFLYDLDVNHNHGNGIGVGASANGYGFGSSYIYYSHVGQVVVAYADSIDHNFGNGFSSSNVLYYGGAMDQAIEVIGDDLSHNGGSGFYSTTHLTSIRGNSFSFSTNVTSHNYVNSDTVDHNGLNGIDIRSYANGAVYAPAFFGGYNYMEQHWQIAGTEANHNGGSGLNVITTTNGRYTLNGTYVTVAGSTFDHNTGDGALFQSNDYYGPGGFGVSLQQVTISGSDFSGNTEEGINISAFSSGRQGRAEQHFTISGSSMDHNGGDGLFIYASAVNGVYVTTPTNFPCTAVQGLNGGCAFVRQNVTVVGSDISHNGNNGVNVVTYANNYGAIYGASGRPHAPTLELYGTTVDSNDSRGLNVSNHVTGNSYLYQYIATIDSAFNHNAADGIYSASYVGGASTMLQRVLAYSYHTGESATDNGGNGFKSSIEALGGSYARDVNIVQGVNLNNNGGFGMDGAVAYADGASTGLQINAVYFNTINNNGDGIGLYSIGAGAQQITYIGGNAIRNNSFVGVYGEANFGAFQYIGVYFLGVNPAGNNVHHNGTDYLFNSFGGSTQIVN